MDTFNCLVQNSNYAMLDVLLIVIFSIVFAIFTFRQKEVKNTLLLASTVTALVAIFFSFAAAASGYSAAVITGYTTRSLVTFAIALLALLFHYLSDL